MLVDCADAAGCGDFAAAKLHLLRGDDILPRRVSAPLATGVGSRRGGSGRSISPKGLTAHVSTQKARQATAQVAHVIYLPPSRKDLSDDGRTRLRGLCRVASLSDLSEIPAAMAVAAPGQLNLDEAPSWGSRSVDCFEKLEQIGEGTYG